MNLKIIVVEIKQFEIWMVDLNPQIGTESPKLRPVLVVQTNLLNNISHPSSLVCPITSNVHFQSEVLRIHLSKSASNLNRHCDIMIDQIRPVDNNRLVKWIGKIPETLIPLIKENLKIMMDL
jgi:mRNA interferase MazF